MLFLQFLNIKTYFPLKVIEIIKEQILNALRYLHIEWKIVHWDLYIGNILISFPNKKTSDAQKLRNFMLSPNVSDDESNEMYLKTSIIDFGMSKICLNAGDGFVITNIDPWKNDKYIEAPEKLEGPVELSFE